MKPQWQCWGSAMRRAARAAGGTIRRATRYRGMLVLVLWQTPMGPGVRADGSVGLMFGSGTDELVEFGCDGNVLSQRRLRHRTGAIELDYSPAAHARLQGVVGAVGTDLDRDARPFFITQVRRDWNRIGAGVGLAALPVLDGDATEQWLSAHLRVGSAERLHVRADVAPPIAHGMHQRLRLGLGINAVDRAAPSALVGAAILGSGVNPTGGVFGELAIPVAGRLSLHFQGHYGEGHVHPVSGVTVGAHLLFPARASPPAFR